MLPRLSRDWIGRTVFIVAGGPSVRQEDVDRLRGALVVVINSSYTVAPWADALLFTDRRWWIEHQYRVRETFEGQIITLTPNDRAYDGLLVLERQRSGGLSTDPTRLAWWHTSLTSAINMIVLRGATRICLLGVDGEGGWHHEPHPAKWGRNENKFGHHAALMASRLWRLRSPPARGLWRSSISEPFAR
jgi:hypothetical protein